MNLDSITPRGRYAELSYSGAIDRAATEGAFAEALQHCLSRGLRAALLDFSATTGTLSALDRMDIARRLAPEWQRGILLAVVVSRAQHLDERPGQLAAQNRGIRAREFLDRQAAVAWLTACLKDDGISIGGSSIEAR